MRRLIISLLTVMTVLAVVAGTALGAITWKSGPTFTENAGADTILGNADDTFTATGEASGLGNRPATAQIVITGTVRYTCENGGGNQSPGQNPVPATTASPVQDLGNSDHNGRGVVDLTAGPLLVASSVGGKVAGCPNKNWTGVNPVVEGQLTATLTIKQGNTLLFSQAILYN